MEDINDTTYGVNMTLNNINNQSAQVDKDDQQLIEYKESLRNDIIIGELIEKIGYSSKQWTILLICFFVLSIEGIQLTDIAFMYIPLKEYYEIGNTEIQIATSLLFTGFALGSILLQIIKKFISRRVLIRTTIVCEFIMHLLLTISPSIVYFILCKFILGFLIGITTPIIINVLCEYIPNKNRSFTMNAVWSFYFIGQLIVLTTMYFAMPKFKSSGIKVVYCSVGILIFFGVISISFLFKDSPRNLALEGNDKEALNLVLEMLNEQYIDYKDIDTSLIINFLKSGDNTSFDDGLCCLFKDKFKFLTIDLMFISFFASLIRYGALLIYIPELQKLDIFTARSMIIGHIISCSAGLVACLITSWVTQFKFFGLVKTGYIIYIIASLFCILTLVNPSNMNIWLAIFLVFTKISYITITAYLTVVYPTKIRDVSSGFFYFCKRIGSIASQFLFLSFVKQSPTVPIFILLFTSITNVVLIYLLPIEPNDNELDREFSHK